LFDDVDVNGNLSQLGDRLSAFDMDGESQLNQAQDFKLSLSVTPRIIVSPVEESLLTELDLVDESMPLAESKSESEQLRKSEVAGSELPALTVANYEYGFAQLGAAVRGWGEFSQQHWSFQRGESLAREAEAAPSARPELKELEELGQVVEDQTRTLKELREKAPANAEKPLAEVDAKAAQEAQLALVRVSRELNRQQRIWYYREGYIRDLEATIAAAEQYAHVPENDFVTPEAQPLSTFGIDVDTASYSNVRRFVESGQLPPPDAVRIEELINSFQYDGPKVEGEHPLAIAAEVSACPWQPQHQLLRVALKGKSIDLQQRPPARLVFLVDTSGSMSDENKLPLVKQSLRILVDQMREQDRLSIVTYSDNAGLLLDSTGGDKREAILAAIEGLNADGSTNGEAGLKLAYEVAVKQFGDGATNRVMLCTDGDFNVGESADSELVKLIEKQRQTGVFLNIFGFGSGNLKDAKLEAIADKGNGQYIYIDGIKEARKTLLNELTGTLYTIAKDVKLQLEFNPNLVGSYRLVGYENRAMAAKDFSNDKVDSGDMGAGHSVVALYEIVPPGAPQPVAPQPKTEPLKYKRAGSVSVRSDAEVAAAPAATLTPSPSPGGRGEPEAVGGQPADPPAEAPKPADLLATELCTIRVRYKQPTSNESTKIETVVSHPHMLRGGQPPVSRDHVWATAVAQFGLLTRHSTFVGTGNYSQVLELAQSAIGEDPTGQRREFVTLVRQTQSLSFERERQLAEISRRAEEHRRVVEEIKTVEKAPDVMTKASVSGKYRTLLRRIEVADDQPLYGEFKDYGRWDGAAYKTHQNLPHGYWVWVAPHWYIWGESTEQAAVDAAK
jgi:Ca-activated chloride channel family protein